MEPTRVTRSAVFAATADELWDHLVDERRLAGWIGAEVRVDGGSSLAEVGAVAALEGPGGSERRAVITTSEPARRLGFVWWDEADPEQASAVELVLESREQGVQLTVVETVPAPTGGGRPCAVAMADVGERWSLRLGALAERVLPQPVLVTLP